MKTGNDSEIPAKISLLKDLAWTCWREGVPAAIRVGRKLEVFKEPKEPALLSNS
jgi:hypothetical protein